MQENFCIFDSKSYFFLVDIKDEHLGRFFVVREGNKPVAIKGEHSWHSSHVVVKFLSLFIMFPFNESFLDHVLKQRAFSVDLTNFFNFKAVSRQNIERKEAKIHGEPEYLVAFTFE